MEKTPTQIKEVVKEVPQRMGSEQHLHTAHYYTPNEAATHWCPMSRVGLIHSDMKGSPVPGLPALTPNRMLQGLVANSGCISQFCACWRWKELPRKADENSPETPGTGFCGLAGKPHVA